MTISANTPKRILLGEGAFVLNYGELDETPAGVTRGGGSFSREVTMRNMPYDGELGPTKGMTRKETVISRLILNALEIVNSENLTKFYAAVDVDESGLDYDELTSKRDVQDSDYLKNVAFVGKTKEGKEVVIIIHNALGDGNMELPFADKDEVVPEVTFTAHYDPETPTEEPWAIRYPKAV